MSSTESDRLEFQWAASKIDPDTTSADLEGPGKYDGASDRVLAWSLETLLGAGAADDVAGDVDSGRHLARFGRYVLETDSQGFVDVFIAYDAEDAQAVLDRESERVSLAQGLDELADRIADALGL